MLKFGRLPHLPRLCLKLSKLTSLTLDASMNLYFIRIVQKQLIEPGLDKYKPLVSHNFRIVFLALLMDVSFRPVFRDHRLYRFAGSQRFTSLQSYLSDIPSLMVLNRLEPSCLCLIGQAHSCKLFNSCNTRARGYCFTNCIHI